jgi:hypothetical protein
MMIYESLESVFKTIYTNTELKLLTKLAKKGVTHKEHKSMQKYFLAQIKNGDITESSVHSFMELYKLPNKSLLLTRKQLAQTVAELFYFYLKEIKLPDSSLGICLGEFYIAGTQYANNISELIQSLELNERVVLVLEEDNPYDAKAVKVSTSTNNKLGYIAKRLNHVPSYMLKNGENLFGVIKKLEWKNGSFDIKIMLYCKV